MANAPNTVLIHVVSPNSEVPERLVFANIPITETIVNLKRRIQDAVPSKPTLERQRIIYRGRALIQHDLTIQSILGSEASNSTEPFTFHLVLSPVDASHQVVGLRPDGLHQPRGLPTLPTHIHGARDLNMPPRPASTSQVPETGQLPNIPNMPFNPLFNMIPQGLQPGQGLDIRMQFTQTGRPFNPPHGVHMPGGALPNQGLATGMLPTWTQEQQLAIAEQQMQALHQQIHQNFVNRGQQHPTVSGINQNPFQNAGGAPFSMAPQLSTDPLQSRPGASREAHQPTVGAAPTQQTTSFTPPPEGLGQGSRQQSTTRQLPAHVMPGLSPMAAANLHALRQNHLQNMQLDQMGQFTQLRNALMNPAQIPRPTMSSQTLQTVYLLSSPSGPEALLVSPSGNFASPHFAIGPMASGLEQTPDTHSNNNRSRSSTQGPIQAPVQPQQAVQPHQPQPQQPQQQQQQQQQPQDQAGELLRILMPLGGHLWLLVRLVGFVYLFSGGRGWRNTIVLGVLALIGFLVQTGIFNPAIQNVWRPVRQHVEGIINAEQPRPRAANGEEQNPQQLADRLVERRANQNALRRAIRRVERSAILFAASLIPGVGESQVRARERMEREQREAEQAAERARIEAEQQAQSEEASGEQKGDGVLTEKAETKEEESPSVAQEQQAQVD